MVPPVRASRPATHFNSVVLPQPLGPTMVRNSCGRMSKSMLLNAATLPRPDQNVLLALRTSTYVVAGPGPIFARGSSTRIGCPPRVIGDRHPHRVAAFAKHQCRDGFDDRVPQAC